MRNPVGLVPLALAGSLMVLPMPGRAAAPEEFGRVIEDVQEFLDDEEYERALGRLRQASQLAQNRKQDITTVRLYEGLILASLGEEQLDRAATDFSVVLQRDLKAKLPITQVSSQVERVFEEVREQVLKEKAYLTPPPWNRGTEASSEPSAQAPAGEKEAFGQALRDIRERLRRQEYELALERVQQVQQLVGQQEQHTTFLLYEGLVFANLARQHQARAKSAFRSALQQDPKAMLPIEMPPHVEHAFEQVRLYLLKAGEAADTLDNPFLPEGGPVEDSEFREATSREVL